MALLYFTRYLTTLAILFSPLLSGAQSKYSLGLSASWPVGNYASTSPHEGSFAQPGWGIMFENEARSKSWPRIFSLGLHLSYQQNAMDNLAMAQEFSLALNRPAEVSEGKYRPFLMTLGPFFDIPLTTKINIGIKTGIGFALTNIDSFALSVVEVAGERPVLYDFDFKSTPSFTFLLGLNGEFKLTRVLGLTVFADFSGARTQVESFVGTAARVQSLYDLQFINTGLGVAVILE
jgi:hypothetical protein